MSYVPPHQRGDDSGEPSVALDVGEQLEEGANADDQNGSSSKVVSTTCVYVEFLPLNVTVEELVHEFAECGEVALDDAGKPRIKLYKHRDGTLKGDGIVNFVDEEGAANALSDMDGRPLRMYGDDDDGDAMVVTMAFFENKEKKQRQPMSPRVQQQSQPQRQSSRSEPRDWRDQEPEQQQQQPKKPFDDSFYDLPTKQPKGKPKPTVDADGWETVGPVRTDEEVSSTPSPPVELEKTQFKPLVKQYTSVVSFDGSVHKGWGDDDSSDEEEEEAPAEPEPIEVEDIEGIDDMTADLVDDTDSEDEEVKEERRKGAMAAKEQQAQGASKQKGKKGKRGLSKKEIKELKQKEDEEFERLLSQAVAEVKSTTVSDGDSSTPETATPETGSVGESPTPPPEADSEPMDKAALAKAAKNKKRKEAAKKKKEEAPKATVVKAPAAAKKEKALSPAEVLALKKEKRAKKDLKLAKERAEANAKKMAVQKKAKELRARSNPADHSDRREKFHFSSENSTGCDAG